jgi:mannose-6-phosphate isomerase-like protein (cupin superfamily)
VSDDASLPQRKYSTGKLISALGELPWGVTVHQKPWGTEQELSLPVLNFTVKRLVVRSNARTSLQVHESKDEVIIILGPDDPPEIQERGFVELAVLGGELTVVDLPVIHVPPSVTHRVTGPLEYLEISTYHPDDVIRLADDYGRS